MTPKEIPSNSEQFWISRDFNGELKGGTSSFLLETFPPGGESHLEIRLVNIIFWLVVSTPLTNMKVSWDDDIPNRWKNESHVPNHQPVIFHIMLFPKRLVFIPT
jgi:hypothetical protein